MTTTLTHSEPFPYKAVLDLSKLVQYWENNLLNGKSILAGEAAQAILSKMKDAKELHGPIKDMSVLKKHHELLGLMMSAVFPSAMLETELMAAVIPFQIRGFYATPGFSKILPFGKQRADIEVSIAGGDLNAARIINAGMCILNRFYDTNIQLEKPMLLTVPDSSGLKKVYKLTIDLQFVDIKVNGALPEINHVKIRELLDNMNDTNFWLSVLPPDLFEFHGFTVFKLTEVTVEESLSSIKYDLLKRDAITSSTSFNTIQDKIRSIFGLADLKIGLTYFDPYYNIISSHENENWHSFILTDESMDALSCDCFEGSIYDHAYSSGKPVVVEDLQELVHCTKVEQSLVKRGIRNIAIAPLVSNGEVIGIFELGSETAGQLNAVNTTVLENVLPMFTAAVTRVLADMQNEVRALIQKECTAIHPSVEWKFLEEGYKAIDHSREGENAELAEIVFDNVFPLYGMSDIRSSSVKRNAAIHEDLERNLIEIKHTLHAIKEVRQMPILDEINHRVDQQLIRLEGGLKSGDESGILDFIRQVITPSFDHFEQSDPEVQPIIKKYKQLLHEGHDVIYDKRKNFEQSLTEINEAISAYLDRVQLQAQQIFPHYFEKYKTDGVEYNIYVGQSLVNGKKFHPIFLKNLRLWQLITMCEINSAVSQLRTSLPEPLEIAQLILVQGDPLSIKFRKDEKHFDVDGAYNIRYEIVKKRIDKAFIKNTNERLTQPGQISIVYTQQKEADEYRQYIEYLQSINYLDQEVEQFELEDLQGAHGLKALRVTVNQQFENQDFGAEVLNQITASLNV